ncbi:MAG: HEPN domain-containing protein [Dehalococcoidia bacterium]|nr:HEPN domain-containing protein [Dehalococcoidia bacterium]
MSLADWLKDKFIEIHRPSAREIANLLHICDRDLEKALIPDLGSDWRLSIAHNAALQAATAALAAAGYRARKEGQHYRVLQSLAFTINTDPAIIKQLDKFRKKRNISDYDRAGMVTEQEAEEMIALAKQLRDDVEQWIRKNHPGLTKEL